MNRTRQKGHERTVQDRNVWDRTPLNSKCRTVWDSIVPVSIEYTSRGRDSIWQYKCYTIQDKTGQDRTYRTGQDMKYRTGHEV